MRSNSGSAITRYVARILTLEDEARHLRDRRRTIYQEIGAEGFHVPAIRAVVRRIKLDDEVRQAFDAAIIEYEQALSSSVHAPAEDVAAAVAPVQDQASGVAVEPEASLARSDVSEAVPAGVPPLRDQTAAAEAVPAGVPPPHQTAAAQDDGGRVPSSPDSGQLPAHGSGLHTEADGEGLVEPSAPVPYERGTKQYGAYEMGERHARLSLPHVDAFSMNPDLRDAYEQGFKAGGGQ
jgi:uncharacterized protein (UPF0335 family)